MIEEHDLEILSEKKLFPAFVETVIREDFSLADTTLQLDNLLLGKTFRMTLLIL